MNNNFTQLIQIEYNLAEFTMKLFLNNHNNKANRYPRQNKPKFNLQNLRCVYIMKYKYTFDDIKCLNFEEMNLAQYDEFNNQITKLKKQQQLLKSQLQTLNGLIKVSTCNATNIMIDVEKVKQRVHNSCQSLHNLSVFPIKKVFADIPKQKYNQCLQAYFKPSQRTIVYYQDRDIQLVLEYLPLKVMIKLNKLNQSTQSIYKLLFQQREHENIQYCLDIYTPNRLVIQIIIIQYLGSERRQIQLISIPILISPCLQFRFMSLNNQDQILNGLFKKLPIVQIKVQNLTNMNNLYLFNSIWVCNQAYNVEKYKKWYSLKQKDILLYVQTQCIKNGQKKSFNIQIKLGTKENQLMNDILELIVYIFS